MAKIAVLDDSEEHVRMVAAPLRVAGHEVLTMTVPLDFDKLIDFAPNVLTLGLARRKEAYDRPIRDPVEDLIGYRSLREIEDYPALRIIPLIIIGTAIQEKDVSTKINYDLFITLPDDFGLLLSSVEELATTVKTRRKIAPYLCPNCKGRLTYVKEPISDLFCPRCQTAVVIIDHENCLYSGKAGESIPCKVDQLKPPAVAKH